MIAEEPPTILLAASMWWPLSARLAAAFLGHGIQIAAASPLGHPIRSVQGISRHFVFGGRSSATLLRSAIEAANPALILPCDDGAVRQLHSLHGLSPALRPLLEHSLGCPENYPLLSSRALFLEVASQLGIRIPVTRVLSASPDRLTGISPAHPAVLKVDGSSGGNGVHIARSPAQAAQAYRRLASPIGAAYAWKRLLIDLDPLPIWSRGQPEQPLITMQQYIPGRPANAMLACWHGELLAMVTVEVLSALGPTGAATVVRIIQNSDIARAARLLTERLQLTGLHGLDFILEDRTDLPFLIELNPRATQLGHLRLPGQGSLASALAAKLLSTPQIAPAEPCLTSDIVAFFPQAMSLNPSSPHLQHGYHDIPWDQPALHHELLRKPWPDRRLLARAYHLLRPRTRHAEASFPTK